MKAKIPLCPTCLQEACVTADELEIPVTRTNYYSLDPVTKVLCPTCLQEWDVSDLRLVEVETVVRPINPQAN